ncbi:MAG: tetracycline regulation of excision, RteC [Mariniphaga sp.]|nr:tetracycline regulation of excision, RteC [Mariniphaga sp.]
MNSDNFTKLAEDLDEKLDHLKLENDPVLVFSEKAVNLCISILQLMKNAVLMNGFISPRDEIDFFRNIKPKVYSKFIFYVKIYSIESKRIHGSIKAQRRLLIAEQDKLQFFAHDNLEFTEYYRSNSAYMDDRYFMRGIESIRICTENLHSLIDKQFSTIHDPTVAIILANDMLVIYFQTELERLDFQNVKNEIKQNVDEHYNSKLYWTGSKIAAFEMIYALHSSGVINNGAVDIMQAVRFAERIFHIDLGDPYHALTEIRSRANGRTKFLDQLKGSLIKRLDESDQFKPGNIN